MMNDIAALQAMYGANFSTNSGNTVYNWDTASAQMFVNGVAQYELYTGTIFHDDLGRRRSRYLRLLELPDQPEPLA